MGNTREAALQGLVHGAVPAVLEVGAALKSAQAWEVEAGLVYDDLAWFLYDELWDIAATARPDLSPGERRGQVALVIDPLLDATVPDDDRAALVVNVFRTVLAARLVPLFGELAEWRRRRGLTGRRRGRQGLRGSRMTTAVSRGRRDDQLASASSPSYSAQRAHRRGRSSAVAARPRTRAARRPARPWCPAGPGG